MVDEQTVLKFRYSSIGIKILLIYIHQEKDSYHFYIFVKWHDNAVVGYDINYYHGMKSLYPIVILFLLLAKILKNVTKPTLDDLYSLAL